MSYLTPLHAYGYFSFKGINEDKIDFQIQLKNILNNFFNSSETNDLYHRSIDDIYVESQFIEYFNKMVSSDTISESLKKDNQKIPDSANLIPNIGPFSDPIDVARSVLPQLEDKMHIEQFQCGMKSLFQIGDSKKSVSLVKSIAMDIISLSTNFAFYADQKTKVCLAVFKSIGSNDISTSSRRKKNNDKNDQDVELPPINLTEYDIFLFNCIQYLYAIIGYRFLIVCNTITDKLLQLFETGLVAEAHVFHSGTNQIDLRNIQNIDTFIYVYQNNIDNSNAVESSNKNSLYQIINFSSSFKNVFSYQQKDLISPSMQAKKYVQTPIHNRFFMGCGIPLFQTSSYISDNVPLTQLRRKVFDVKLSRFQSWSNGRLPIGHYYANFEDIHTVKIGFFLYNQIYLAEGVDPSIINSIVNLDQRFDSNKLSSHYTVIKEQCDYSISNDAKLYSVSIDIKLLKDAIKNYKTNDDLFNILYHLKSIIRIASGESISDYSRSLILRDTQILSIYQTVSNILNNKKSNKKGTSSNEEIKGTIFQIETGEGKTIIIECVALLLALFEYNVHIITHNIMLSYRDYRRSYQFYQGFGIESDILFHKQEHKRLSAGENQIEDDSYDDNDDGDDDESMQQQNYIDKLTDPYKDKYNDDDFELPLDLNSKVLHYDDKRGRVIYSTAFNFEASFLVYKEKYPKKDLLKNTICIIDEADSMLLDDINNGTTISKPIQSEVEEAIPEIYEFAIQTDQQDMKSRVEKLKTRFGEKYPCLVPKDGNGLDLEKLLIDADHVRNNMELQKHYFIQKRPSIKNRNNNVFHIVPYDYKKGTLEDSKQYEGYIHQFIAAKENMRIRKNDFEDEEELLNELVEMEPLSVNYLYTSHPVYLRKYDGIIGCTGTIGSTRDIIQYKNLYHIQSQKIPRNLPNYRFDITPILTSTIEERNEKIINEIRRLSYLNKIVANNKIEKRSILVIIENPNEVRKLLEPIATEEFLTNIKLKVKTDIPDIDMYYKCIKKQISIKYLFKQAKSKADSAREIANQLQINKNPTKKDIDVITSLNIQASNLSKSILKKINKFRQEDTEHKEVVETVKAGTVSILEIMKTIQETCTILGEVHKSYDPSKDPTRDPNKENQNIALSETKQRNMNMYDSQEINSKNQQNANKNKKNIKKKASFHSSAFFPDIYAHQKVKRNNMNIFDEPLKPIDVIIAGNNYGRGKNADLEVSNTDHLHVIIGFYSQNIRSVHQARGRTGRNGRSGTTQIICLKSDYFSSIKENEEMKNPSIASDTFLSQDCSQEGRDRVVKHMEQCNHNWIFEEALVSPLNCSKVFSKYFTNDFYAKIRNYTINVGRELAYKYKFPFGFNTVDYFKIQQQRIYSIINCPNSVYTWRLVSRYYREMVLEGWSLFINHQLEMESSKLRNSDDRIKKKLGEDDIIILANKHLLEVLDQKLEEFYNILEQYLPINKQDPKQKEIDYAQDLIDSFLFLTSKVNEQYQYTLKANKYSKLLYMANGKLSKGLLKKRGYFISFKFGPYPFTYLEAKETSTGLKYEPNITIQDPELKYMKFSITKYLDKVFDLILEKLNEQLRKYVPIDIYLKRTVGGTEFGFCFQPFIYQDKKEHLVLTDIDLTFIAAINVKSEKVLLISILLIVAAIIASFFTSFTGILKLTFKEVLIKIVEKTVEDSIDSLLDLLTSKICAYLVLLTRQKMGDSFFGSRTQAILQFFVSAETEVIFQRFRGIAKLNAMILKIGVCFIMYMSSVLSSYTSKPAIKSEQPDEMKSSVELKSESIDNHRKLSETAKNRMDDAGFDEFDRLKGSDNVLDKEQEEADKFVNSQTSNDISEIMKEFEAPDAGEKHKAILANIVNNKQIKFDQTV